MKHDLCRRHLQLAVTEGENEGLGTRRELLLAMLVVVTEAYAEAGGAEAAVEALTYEIDNLTGYVETDLSQPPDA